MWVRACLWRLCMCCVCKKIYMREWVCVLLNVFVFFVCVCVWVEIDENYMEIVKLKSFKINVLPLANVFYCKLKTWTFHKIMVINLFFSLCFPLLTFIKSKQFNLGLTILLIFVFFFSQKLCVLNRNSRRHCGAPCVTYGGR